MGLAKLLSCKSWSMRLLPRWNIGIPMMTAVNKIRKGKIYFFLVCGKYQTSACFYVLYSRKQVPNYFRLKNFTMNTIDFMTNILV